ncbi:gas vesicle protein GvpJ [Candidatus Solirubrobacter pratensis]|uniref:gas vesicle protein GvpJ n=1 Tax=Candidatus Solirubrobacter pratensis TaxID=1298857 RepID=UPI00041A2AD3
MAASNRYAGGPSPSGLADVLDLILDKGLVIDAYVRLSLVGIEILTVDARIVVASVDTYLRFAEAVGRLDLEAAKETPLELKRTAKSRMKRAAAGGAVDAVTDEIADAIPDD